MTASWKSIFSSKGAVLGSAAWASFIAENLILSHNRDEIIDAFDERVYSLSYSTLSTVSCGAIAYTYLKYCRNKPPFLPARGVIYRAASFVFASAGLIGFSQLAPKLQIPVIFKQQSSHQSESSPSNRGVASSGISFSNVALSLRCPIDFKDKRFPTEEVHGLERISRHPVLWSLAFLGLSRALVTTFAPEAIIFSFPTLVALILGEHKDYRFRRHIGGELSIEKDHVTSNIPFLALVLGRQSWSALGDEIKWTNAGIGVTLACILALITRRV